jgi:hypothetical protein
MSEVKVNKISPRTNCGTTTLGDSGDTFNIPCGSKINVASGGNITVASGGTITNNGTQTGFGSTYSSVDFETTKKTGTFTAVAGKGYFCDTTSTAFTCNLPSSPSAGDCVALKDYAKTFGTNALTIGRGGSNIDGGAFDSILEADYESVMFIYVDGTQGWKSIISNNGFYGAAYVVASGGNSTATCGDYKIHTFTSPGTFSVTGGSGPLGFVEYIVVGGGGGGSNHSPLTGGGGAGGFRFASPSLAPLTYPAKPLAAPAGLTVTSSPGSYTVSIGGGGPNGGAVGSVSTFGPLTAAGGGTNNATPACHDGGSGAGQGAGGTYGSGNTPPVSPPQGNDGGASYDDGGSNKNGGGGGGAITAGINPGSSASPSVGGTGAGVPNAFGTSGQNCGSTYYFAGGGGGGGECMPGVPPGGLGGGGAGGRRPGTPASVAGTANTGGGGGGRSETGPHSTTGVAAAGGSGIVIIRYKFQ